MRTRTEDGHLLHWPEVALVYLTGLLGLGVAAALVPGAGAALSDAVASDAALWALIVFFTIGLPGTLFVVCTLKGKPGFALLGLMFGIFHLVGAIRLAKPNSWWARRYYRGLPKMAEAMQRFPKQASKVPPEQREELAEQTS